MSTVIYHNPDCGTSRVVLAILRSTGVEPVVIEYLDKGWTREQLKTLFAEAGVTPRTALYVNNSLAADLGLLDSTVDDEQILDAMLEHAVLVNRPFVCTSKGVRLCRPTQLVLSLLEKEAVLPLYNDNGEMIVDAEGVRIV